MRLGARNLRVVVSRGAAARPGSLIFGFLHQLSVRLPVLEVQCLLTDRHFGHFGSNGDGAVPTGPSVSMSDTTSPPMMRLLEHGGVLDHEQGVALTSLELGGCA